MDQKSIVSLLESERFSLDTFGGRVHVEFCPQAAVTPLGQLPFFIDFLKTSRLYEPWVSTSPLRYSSGNAPDKRDVLGTLFLSILAGHWRYAHMTAIRSDGVNPDLLGMNRVVSEDSARRAFKNTEEEAGLKWLGDHLKHLYEPLLVEPWILDVDTTIKPLYGKQQGAVLGYNPHKPGRPCHVYHSYMMANVRLLLDVEVQQGNQQGSCHSLVGLWSILDDLPKSNWPDFIRGDCAWGNERVMHEAEQRSVGYLFKLRQTPKVKRLVQQVFHSDEWESAGQGWQGLEAKLKLSGWTKTRRVIVLRRAIKSDLLLSRKKGKKKDQFELGFIEVHGIHKKYEYAVLVTSLEDEVLTIAQHYRDRADIENCFDELKNQWGWGGYTTQDLKRTRIMAKMVGLIYNWWSLFVRLGFPHKHKEAITSRPLLLEAIAKGSHHAGQKRVTITSLHGKVKTVRCALLRIIKFLQTLKRNAEQFTQEKRWRYILSKIFVKYLRGRILQPPKLLPNTP